MSSYRSKAFYSPPDGSSGSLPITPTEEEEQPTLSTSLPPSLGKLILNRSTPYNLSPPSSFGSSTSSSSSSSITSQQSTMSTSSAFALGGGSVPSSSSLGPPRPHVALLPPPHLKTYQYTNLQPQLPPTPSSLPLNRILLPPLDSIPRHLSTLPQHASASASTSSSLALPPPPPSTIVSQPQLQRPHQPPPVETANSRHDIAFHELREQQHQLQPQQQARASSSSSSFSTPLPQSYLPPPDTTRKPPSTSSTTAADSTAEPNPSGEADYPMMSLVVRKRRRRTSPGELAILDAHFSKNPLPTAHEREVIAKQVEMTPRHIQIWVSTIVFS
ncbi:hypothetical protein BDY24DRAFT_17752 [Mrakia frigida]|uniref:uncharacterized protein n=1 Tax=Mrakia frigida TaxID=29902 RepID=UPI003FCBF30A